MRMYSGYIRKASPAAVEDFLFDPLLSFSASEVAGVFSMWKV
jgi:hypothetical protein